MKAGLLAKILISAGCVFTAGAIGTVGVLSVLSDVVTTTGSITAASNVLSTDTLDIAGAYQVYLNGSSTPEATNNVTLNPGDVAVVKATITNYGNASAWVKDEFSYSAISPFSFHTGEHTAAEFEAGLGSSTSDIYIFGGANAESVAYGTTTRVVKGTGTGAQIETPANATTELKADVNVGNPIYGYNEAMFTNGNSYTLAYSVYFDPDTATTGSEVLNFTAKTSALEYRANNLAFPKTTCDAGDPPVCTGPWTVVVSSPVGL